MSEPSPTFPTRSLTGLTVVLVAPRNPLNIGAVARAMSNFGAEDLRVVRVFREDYREAASAVGPSAQLLAAAQEFASVPAAVQDAALIVGTTGAPGRTFQQPFERLEASAVRMGSALERGERVALLFGSEKFGLSNEDMSYCHTLLRIPTRDQHASMNLGQAAAVCLYELARNNVAAEKPAGAFLQGPQRRASAASMDRLTEQLIRTLLACEYQGLTPGTRTHALRALLRRWRLSEQDASLATGFLRQMLWKLGANGD